ncbi:MAG: ASKHA domain-containing protein [Anaerolineae bacterium]
MPEVTFVEETGAGERVHRRTVEEGTTLWAVGVELGLLAQSACGGRGICGKCRVRVAGDAPPPTEADRRLFRPADLEAGWRLACRLQVERDLTVHVPRAEEGLQVMVEGRRRPVPVEPLTRKVLLALPRPSLSDQRSDWARLEAALAAVGQPADGGSLSLWRDLPRVLRQHDFLVTVALHGRRILDVQGGDTTGSCYGLAFDLGTTTVVGILVDLNTGRQVGVAAALNGQAIYGSDVLTRLTFAQSDPQGVQKLRARILETVNGLVDEVLAQAGVAREDVYAMTVVGNTIMEHLFLGLDPRGIAVSPFVPVIGHMVEVSAAEAGVHIHPRAVVTVFPVVGGYVGGDTVGVILATELHQDPRIRLAIDIGTNGEIVLGSRERLLACAAAAGPAFEGAQISCGMRAASGAIDQVVLGEEVRLRVLGGGVPRGICGSGLLDAVAELVRVGLVDTRGRLLLPEEAPRPVPQGVAARVHETETGRAFLLDGPRPERPYPLDLTQQDIRQLQLAKGAICAGVRILERELGVAHEEVAEVLLAGAFGSYLNPKSALAVGLIPPTALERVLAVGNAAAEGARLALLSARERRTAQALPRTVEYVELSSRPDFPEEFLKALAFPEPR